MVVRLKSVEPVRLGVVVAVVAAVFGFLAGLLVGPAIAWLYAALPILQMVRPADSGFGLLPIVVFPLVAGASGFAVGVLVAFAYNVLAHYTGGIEATLEERIVVAGQTRAKRGTVRR